MKRDSVQTVTLPILVESEGWGKTNNMDDWGTFFPADWKGSMGVHVVTEADVKLWLRSELSPKEHNLFVGLNYLKFGIDERDEYTLMRGYDKLRPIVKDLAPPEDTKRVDLKTKDGTEISFLPVERKWTATVWNYSGLFTEALKNTRFVMWGSETYNRFLPALFCRDKKTAVFAMRLAGSLRVCPKCDAPFVPSAGNVDYCCIEHREAYRIARFRWNKKKKLAS